MANITDYLLSPVSVDPYDQALNTTDTPSFVTVNGRDIAVDGTKLDLIEASATADQTGAEIKVAYEAEADTNAFTDAEQTKLGDIDQGVATTDSPTFVAVSTDTINEATGAAGVTADGVLHKDGIVTGGFVVASSENINGVGTSNAFTISANEAASQTTGAYIQMWGSTSVNTGAIVLGSSFGGYRLDSSSFRPLGTNVRDLGSSAQAWKDGYFTGTVNTDTISELTASAGVSVNGMEVHNGSGTPESVVSAPVGSIYTRTDGGTGTTLYVKESGTGNTGWAAK